MSIFSLPISTSPDNTQTIVLDKVAYRIRIQWSTRDEAWDCFWGKSGEGFKFKFKIVNGLDLLQPFKAYDECPDGILFVVDSERVYGRVGRDNFGIDKRFELLYQTPDDTEVSAVY